MVSTDKLVSPQGEPDSGFEGKIDSTLGSPVFMESVAKTKIGKQRTNMIQKNRCGFTISGKLSLNPGYWQELSIYGINSEKNGND